MTDNRCTYCNEEYTSIPFKCKFCSEMFCGDHRLPEKHDCQGLKAYNKSKSKTYFTEVIGLNKKKHYHKHKTRVGEKTYVDKHNFNTKHKSFNHRKITSPLGKFFKGIWNFIIGIIVFIYDFIAGIISFLIDSIWGLMTFLFWVVVIIFLISIFSPQDPKTQMMADMGLIEPSGIDGLLKFGEEIFYDVENFIFGFFSSDVSEECRAKVLSLTPDKLIYEDNFIESGFEFSWNDGTKTNFKEGFKLTKGEKEGQNIRYYYPNREFEYSKKVVDSSGVIVGEDKFRAKLIFQPVKNDMGLGMGTISFKVVNITPTYCNFYDPKEIQTSKNTISKSEVITDFKDLNKNPKNYIGKTLIVKGESYGSVNLCGGAVLTDSNGYKVYVANNENRALGRAQSPTVMTFEGRFRENVLNSLNSLNTKCYQIYD